MFDKRGTGMSDRGSQIFTLEQRMHGRAFTRGFRLRASAD
jgi:hypothetical protein